MRRAHGDNEAMANRTTREGVKTKLCFVDCAFVLFRLRTWRVGRGDDGRTKRIGHVKHLFTYGSTIIKYA